MSVSPDGETFISADERAVNLWNFENNIISYNLLSLPPSQNEEFQEIITHVELHNQKSDKFIYSSSAGCACICDLRKENNHKNQSIKF